MKIKHISWRDGRPRFSPGQQLRAAGHKSKDLRHPDGRWYSVGEALDWSRDFVAAIVREPQGASAQTDEQVHPATKGYVYFLGTSDRVKVGFSTNPGSRLLSLKTGASDPMLFFFAVPGTRYDERRLHVELESHRSSGEWFKKSLSVIRVMQRHLAAHIERLDFRK